MSTIKVNIATISEKNGWLNIVTAEDKELSVLIKDGKNPKTKAALSGATAGQTVELPAKIVEKDGKSYVWDVEEKKGGFNRGGNYEPKDQGTITALSCLSSAATLFSLQKGTPEQVVEAAKIFFEFATSKTTIKAETPKA